MYQQIRYEVDDPVATITFNRPERLNALTERLLQEVKHALADAERRAEVVGIVLTGAGRGFCAGMDMEHLQQVQAAGRTSSANEDVDIAGADPGDRRMGNDFTRGLTYLLSIPKPVLAAINGPCAGMGFSLAMLCDLRFAAEDAIFTTAYAQRGLVAEHGTSWILPRLVGPARALDLLWSGRRFDGREALQLGVVNAAVPTDRVVATAQDYVRKLAANAAPRSLMHMKQQVYRHLLQPLGEAMAETERLMDESASWPDFKEGVASFLDRRSPQFARVQGT